jgi:Flp pilus assembly protein CpaB
MSVIATIALVLAVFAVLGLVAWAAVTRPVAASAAATVDPGTSDDTRELVGSSRR